MEEEKTKKKNRQLNMQEKSDLVKCISRKEVIAHVKKTVPNELVPSLYPDRLFFWESICESEESKQFLDQNIDRYLFLYKKHAKGKDKYASLYLDWLNVIRSFTCPSQQTMETKLEWSLVSGTYGGGLAEDGQVTVIASILHAVQDSIHAQMATLIEGLGKTDVQSDDTALYRVSGWALKSTIDHRKKDLKQGRGNPESIKMELAILNKLKCSKDTKASLPIGTRTLDRGGLTFLNPALIVWARAVEISIKEHLKYQKYGQKIFKVRMYMYVRKIIDSFPSTYTGYKGQCFT